MNNIIVNLIKHIKYIRIVYIILSLTFLPNKLYATTNDTIINSIVATGKDGGMFDEFVVTGVRDETTLRHLPMTVSVVSRQTLEESGEISILPVLNTQVPGFFSSSRGTMGYGVSTGAAGQMSIRGIGGPAQAGLPTTGVLVLIDGSPQYMGLMGHPIADAYSTMTAEKVEVLRTPASVLYGSNAMGGVVNIITRKINEDDVKTHIKAGAGSYGTVETEFGTQIRKKGFSSNIMASYNRSDGHRANMGFDQYSGYLKLGYDFNDKWKLWGDLNLTHFNSQNPGPINEPLLDNKQNITRGMANISIENKYEITSGRLNLYYSLGKHYINDGHTADEAPLDYRFRSFDNMLGLSIYQSIQMYKGNRLTLGFDYFRTGGYAANENVMDLSCTQLVDTVFNEFAGYVDFRQDIWGWLSIDAGFRISYHDHTGIEYVPQAGLAFHVPYEIEIKAIASKGYRNPTIREMYLFGPANPDLQAERVWSYELSFSQNLLDGKLTYSLAGYYINGDNLIMRMPNPSGGGMLNQNSGAIENWGMEMEADYRINGMWHINANYSWLHMENPVLYSPEHKLYAGCNFDKGRWHASTGIQYIKGLYSDLQTPIKEEYVLWNINLKVNILKWISIYINAENILAQQYEIIAGYPMPTATFMGGILMDF